MEKIEYKDKKEKKEKQDKKQLMPKKREEELVRILATDIPVETNVFHGLTRIKGVSWSFSNAICHSLGIDKSKKIKDLSPSEMEKIEKSIKNPNVPIWLLNRRKDYSTGEDKHLIASDLDYQKEMDVRRLKKIHSYKGLRHALGLPVRGQRTRAHFRQSAAIGVLKGAARTKAKAPPAAAKSAAKASKEKKKGK